MKRVKVITIGFAFMLLFVAVTVQPVAAASRSDSLRSYISGRFDVERGGYSPPLDNVVRVSSTYGAILALDELGSLVSRPPPINLTSVLDSLIVRQWDIDSEENDSLLDYQRYGGFSEYLVGPVTMKMNQMAIILFDMLKAQSDYPGIDDLDFNQTSLLIHMERSLTESGGFSSVPTYDPDIVSTYQALFVLDYLDTYNPSLNAWDVLDNETATLEWINSCRSGDGFKLSPDSDSIGVVSTAAGILALDLLPGVSTVSGLQAATNWVLARQVIDDELGLFSGGFEEGVGTGDPNFESTYFALKLLEFSGGLVSVNETEVVDFILNCQTADGSFGFIPEAATGSLVYAGQACELLSLFGNAASILASSEDPYSVGGVVLDWRYLVIAGILIMALVLAIVSVRRD